MAKTTDPKPTTPATPDAGGFDLEALRAFASKLGASQAGAETAPRAVRASNAIGAVVEFYAGALGDVIGAATAREESLVERLRLAEQAVVDLTTRLHTAQGGLAEAGRTIFDLRREVSKETGSGG